MQKLTVRWTDYLKYRAKLRGFSLERIEEIVLYSSERYLDTVTLRKIVVGRHDAKLVLIPYDEVELSIVPVTIHVTTRTQIKIRIQSGRYSV